MSNQGTIRLKVTNSAPAIEKLWNNRYKLEFFCDNNSPKEDWYYKNVSNLLPDYGILQTTNFGSGVNEDWEAIPDSVYPDMCLVLAEYPYNVRVGKHYVKLTYETLTASWVEEKDEDTDYELNGLKRVLRTFVALPATTYDKVVGTSTIDSNGTTLYLGSFKIEETDAKWSLSEVWLEAGELNREENSEDAKGSISITQIGGCPAAPAGYTVVNESKNNTQGFETCSRTFYKNDSELSRSNDYVGSQLAETIEVFSPTAEPTPTNGAAVLGNKSTSNVDGIPTIRYTFLVPSVLSESSDKVGSQLAITIEAFNETPATPAGYVIASEQASDFEGIPTTRYTFLKPSVLSQSTDKVGSQLAITIESFSEVPATPSGYVLANEQTSDVDGIPTRRYTFLKAGILSQSNDYVGSQLAVVIEAFNETPATPAGHVLANTQVSDFEGIKTNRYTFLKPSILSQSEDKVGSQLAITIEAFSLYPSAPDSYVLANEQVSDVEGINTTRYTFLKPSILNKTEDKVGSQNSIVIEAFNLTPLTPTGYVLANIQVSDVDGISTNRYTFLKENVELFKSEDKVGGQLAIVIEQFNGIPAAPTGYSIASTQESDIKGIPTKRYTFLKDNVELSRIEDKVGSQLSITIEQFNGVPATPTGHLIASERVSDFGGIPTKRYTFLKPSILSQTEDKVGSQNAIVIETFNLEPSNGSHILAKTEISNFEGIPTKRYTFLKECVLSETEDLIGSQKAEIIEIFGSKEPTPSNGGTLAKTETSNVEGIPTKRYTFLKECVLSETNDLVGSQQAEIVETFNLEPTPSNGGTLAKTEISDFEGIPTKKYTFLKEGTLSETIINDGKQNLKITEVFGNTTDVVGGNFLLVKSSTSDINGIPTIKNVYAQKGLINQTKTTLSDGLIKTTFTYLGEANFTSSGILTGKTINNVGGIQTVTLEYMTLPNAGAYSYNTTVPFSVPGTVDTANEGDNIFIKASAPYQVTAAATVTVTYTTKTSTSTQTLYQAPHASAMVVGRGFNYRPISSTNTFANHVKIGNTESITGSPVEEAAYNACMGVVVAPGSTAKIELSGVGSDPCGGSYTVSASKDAAFTAEDGKVYYKEQVVNVSVPSRRG